MQRTKTIPVKIPNVSNIKDYTKDQYSSCLTKLYGISPDIKVSPEMYMKWCKEQQQNIDDFIQKRNLEEQNKKNKDRE